MPGASHGILPLLKHALVRVDDAESHSGGTSSSPLASPSSSLSATHVRAWEGLSSLFQQRRPPLSSLVPVPEWGDVPGWLQGAAEAGALCLALRGRRQAQAIDWATTLKKLSGLSEEELRRTVEDNPAIAELVYIAWEGAAQTADDHKRRLLAHVAAAALSGDTTPEQIEPLQFLLRTMVALDPPHITLLVIIGKREGPKVGPYFMWKAERLDIEADWPGPEDVVDAALTTLEGLNLIEERGIEDGWDTDWRLAWGVTPYGRRFLDFLLIDAGGWPPAN
jgi:hypothetical protein